MGPALNTAISERRHEAGERDLERGTERGNRNPKWEGGAPV